MRPIFLAFISLVGVQLSDSPVFAQAVVAVRFAAGQPGTTITDRISGRAYKDYRVGVRAGQTLNVNMRTLRGSPYFNVMEPGQRDIAIYIGSTNGAQFSARTRYTGAYTIRVYQMRATGRRGETAAYRLRIDAFGRVTGDAMVPGTPYHATSQLRCRTTPGAFGMCKAGVIRRGGGSASVHLDTYDGGQLTILFRSGSAVSSDANVRLVVERRGDTSIVRIGAVEIYEVPDALVFGG